MELPVRVGLHVLPPEIGHGGRHRAGEGHAGAVAVEPVADHAVGSEGALAAGDLPGIAAKGFASAAPPTVRCRFTWDVTSLSSAPGGETLQDPRSRSTANERARTDIVASSRSPA